MPNTHTNTGYALSSHNKYGDAYGQAYDGVLGDTQEALGAYREALDDAGDDSHDGYVYLDDVEYHVLELRVNLLKVWYRAYDPYRSRYFAF